MAHLIQADPAANAAPRRRARGRPAWRLLLAHVGPHRWPLLAGGLLGFLGGLAALAEPMLAKLVIDALGRHRPLLGPVALLAVLLVGGALLNATGSYLLGRTAESVVLTARQGLSRQLLRLPMGVLDRLRPGDLLSRVTSDTTLLRSVSTFGLVQSINAAFLLVASVVLMALLDPVLLGVTLAVLALNGIAALVVVPRIRRATERSQAAVGEMSSVLERALGAFRTVKASGAEEREIATVGEGARRAWRRGVEVAGWTALMEVSAGLAVQLSFLAVLGIGGARVASGALPVSSLIAFLLYLFLLSEPITSLVAGASQLQAGLAATVRMREVHELPTESQASDRRGFRPSLPVVGPASVAFDRVWFRYRFPGDSHWVHRDLSFELPPGGMTAIVGPSGAGKTTVFALLERFYEPQSGTVAIDGRDIRGWSLPELRASIGYVEQDAPILAGTLRDNLRLAAPAAQEDELSAVLALTRLDDLLVRLPDGLDTPVGHHGVTLSGGQRQRIAIARALLRQPRLLLLDEATSQLDAVNELALRDVIAEVAGSTTVLVVAHRLSTVTSADRILVMDAGRVRATGAHDELTQADDLYRRLAESQFLVAEQAIGMERARAIPPTVG
jgi:ABC-type multidrug transport system fused ATPase/permease subunit